LKSLTHERFNNSGTNSSATLALSAITHALGGGGGGATTGSG
jgi:hypothetical protein